MKNNWSGGLAEWIEDGTAYISVVFSWKLPQAFSKAVWYKAQGYKVRVGGPAVWTRPKFLESVAEIGGEVNALIHHNPQATVASRGCPVGCSFCLVPAMEGREFTLLWDFTPRPILMDNNLSALPVEFQEHIIRRYQETNTPLRDAQEGFEPCTFDEDCYHRWKAINKGPWRLGFDTMDEASEVQRAMRVLENEYHTRKRIYVLIGNEPVASCYERILKVIEWGGEPHVQPVMALNTLVKRPLVRYDWTLPKLYDMARWANRWLWRSLPLQDYCPRKDGIRAFADL